LNLTESKKLNMSNIKLNDILKDILAESTKLSSTDIKDKVTKMLNLSNNDVSISLSSPYNQIKFTVKKDIEKEKFNKVIKYLEDNGYKVDKEQSYNTYDDEDGNSTYPRIRF
jgi:tRNA G26 N,N-dimethylase Trm1